ncbi:MAG: uncharacterized protein KVP18_000366 [Porospora cf. gigantea A]|nr:MAG: hypothetical protein KVP18_000366 [Porospora cf. gigantea A]
MPTLSASLTPCKGFTSSDRCSALVTLEDFHIASAASGFCQLWNLTQRRFRFWDLSGNAKGGSLKRFAYGQAFIHPQIHPSADSVSSLCALQLPSKEDLSSCLVAGVNEGVYVVW